MNSRILSHSAVLLCLAAVAFFVIFPVQDFDTFWHVANGRWMIDNGQPINKEVFSFTAFGKEFHNHEWLGQILLYMAYSLGGMDGLIGLKVVVMLLTTSILFVTAKKQGAGPVIIAALILFMFIAALPRLTDRPVMFSMLGLALLGLLLHGYRLQHYGKRALYFIPVILVLWDTLHGSVYGLILLGAFFAGESLKRVVPDKWRSLPGMTTPMSDERYRHLWIWLLITLLATLLNPYGLLTYDVFFELLSDNINVVMTGEFMPTTWEKYPVIWCYILAVAASLVWCRKCLDITHILIFLPFAYLSIRYMRGIEALGPVGIPFLAYGVAQLAQQAKSPVALRASKVTPLLLVIVALGYITQFKLSDDPLFSYGTGVNEKVFPVSSVRFINDVKLPGNMYNSDKFGGYLAYFLDPQFKIFHYNHPKIFDALENYVHHPESRQKWNINYAIVGREDEFAMFVNDGFVPIYFEPSASVLIRNNEANRPIIERYKSRYFSASYDIQKLAKTASHPMAYPVVMREIATSLKYRTDPTLAQLFGQLIMNPNDYLPVDERIALLLAAEKYNATDVGINTALGAFLLQVNQLESAEEHLNHALQQDATQPLALANRGFLYSMQERHAQAANDFQTLLKQNPTNGVALYGLGMTHYNQRQFPQAKAALENYLQQEPNGFWGDRARQMLGTLH